MKDHFHLAWFLSQGYGPKTWRSKWPGSDSDLRRWMMPDLFIDLAVTIFVTSVTSSSGSFNHSFQIPNNTAFNDADLFAQVIVLDAAANRFGMVVSNAYQTELGMVPRMASVATTSLTTATGSLVRNNGIVSLFRYQ